jgi:hypothetical protein
MLAFCLLHQELSEVVFVSCKIGSTFATAHPFVGVNTKPAESKLPLKETASAHVFGPSRHAFLLSAIRM